MNPYHLPGLSQILNALTLYGGPRLFDLSLKFHLTIPQINSLTSPVIDANMRIANFDGLKQDLTALFACTETQLIRGFSLAELISAQVAYLRRKADTLEKTLLPTGDKITVCDACFQASCWQGAFMCDYSLGMVEDGGGHVCRSVQKTKSELELLALENSCYWITDEELAKL